MERDAPHTPTFSKEEDWLSEEETLSYDPWEVSSEEEDEDQTSEEEAD